MSTELYRRLFPRLSSLNKSSRIENCDLQICVKKTCLYLAHDISDRKVWHFDDLWHIPESIHCTYPDFNLTLFTCKHFILWSEIFSLAGRLNLVLIWILTEGGAIQSRKKGMDFWYPIRLLHYDPIGWRTGQIFYHLSNFDQFSKYVTIINLAMSSAQPLSSK